MYTHLLNVPLFGPPIRLLGIHRCSPQPANKALRLMCCTALRLPYNATCLLLSVGHRESDTKIHYPLDHSTDVLSVAPGREDHRWCWYSSGCPSSTPDPKGCTQPVAALRARLVHPSPPSTQLLSAEVLRRPGSCKRNDYCVKAWPYVPRRTSPWVSGSGQARSRPGVRTSSLGPFLILPPSLSQSLIPVSGAASRASAEPQLLRFGSQGRGLSTLSEAWVRRQEMENNLSAQP